MAKAVIGGRKAYVVFESDEFGGLEKKKFDKPYYKEHIVEKKGSWEKEIERIIKEKKTIKEKETAEKVKKYFDEKKDLTESIITRLVFEFKTMIYAMFSSTNAEWQAFTAEEFKQEFNRGGYAIIDQSNEYIIFERGNGKTDLAKAMMFI